MTPITSAHLYSADNDTEPDGIVYRVGQTMHGDVSLIAASTGAAIKNFTQADINLQQVIFILQGLSLFLTPGRCFHHKNVKAIILSECWKEPTELRERVKYQYFFESFRKRAL